MEELLAQIEQADDITISRIIQAVIRRYGRVYPDHEVLFCPCRETTRRNGRWCCAMH